MRSRHEDNDSRYGVNRDEAEMRKSYSRRLMSKETLAITILQDTRDTILCDVFGGAKSSCDGFGQGRWLRVGMNAPRIGNEQGSLRQARPRKQAEEYGSGWDERHV